MQGRAETGSNPLENRLGRVGPGKQDLDRYSRHQGVSEGWLTVKNFSSGPTPT